MLDPAQPVPLDLASFDTYLGTCLRLARERLAGLTSLERVALAQDDLNQYPRLAGLSEPRDILVLDEHSIQARDIERAAETLLSGGVLLEHACAGEATRLGLGTKYLIVPRRDLTPAVLAELLGPRPLLDNPPDSLRPLSLGRRHMLQMAWDLWQLALEMGQDPRRALGRQHLLVIVNDASAQRILEDFQEAGFYGFDRRKVLFMVQRAFHGLNYRQGAWFHDTASPLRLHNHGQMLMQTTMEQQIFHLDEMGRRRHLAWQDYQALLEGMEDKLSFNIEDLDYLTRSLDLPGLAAALKLADQGARMVMEVVANNPEHPIKGGACYWDPELGRNVMIESFQLKGIAPAHIRFLNKNVNHYPRPALALAAVRQRGLAMPIAVKKGFLYFQPVQGDVNFLVPTAFLRRVRFKPIRAWKAAVHTPEALAAMADQDQRPGFLAWASGLTGLAL
ncbi:MAG: hypothetical protein HY794_16975 [Desulfarculus sp.]|nr:hypothetical protein [Desulfarculus sp.]